MESRPQYWSWTDQRGTDDDDDDDGGGGGDGGVVSKIQFLLLPNGIVTIDPSDSMLSQIGQTALHLDDLLVSSERHNKGLSTERLVQFSLVGQALITSLTTTKEDIVIFDEMKEKLSRLHIHSGKEEEQLRDQISAVDYRIHFKEAVQTALGVVEKLLILRKRASCDS